MRDGYLTVGELARATGTTVRTLHYYEQVGLLGSAGRTEAGHRYYSPDQAAEVRLIKALQALGFLRSQISQLKTVAGSDEPGEIKLDRVQAICEAHYQAIRRKAQLYGRLERNLKRLSPASILQLATRPPETLRRG